MIFCFQSTLEFLRSTISAFTVIDIHQTVARMLY